MNDIEHALSTSTLKAFDITALWLKETFVDIAAGELTVLRPVTSEGTPDFTRAPKFYSSVVVTLNGQTIPVPFEIEGATSLKEAADKWLAAGAAAGRTFIEKSQEHMRRQQILAPAPLPRKLHS